MKILLNRYENIGSCWIHLSVLKKASLYNELLDNLNVTYRPDRIIFQDVSKKRILAHILN